MLQLLAVLGLPLLLSHLSKPLSALSSPISCHYLVIIKKHRRHYLVVILASSFRFYLDNPKK